MRIKGNHTNLIDYIFWIVLVIYTNPGGILEALGEDSGDGGVNVKDYLFVVLFFCYVLVFYVRYKDVDRAYDKIFKYLIFFMLYHFFVFAYFVPIFKETSNATMLFIILKNRHELISFILFILVYEFYKRSYKIFFKVLLYSSIIVITLFLITVVLGVDILPIEKVNRGFVNIDRIFMTRYGIMPFLIPMGAVMIAFKIDIKWRKIILVGFGLMFLVWLLSLTRRHILGTIIYLLLGLMLNNYFLGKRLVPFSRIFTVMFYSGIMFFFIYLTFPKYIDAGIRTAEEAIYVIRYGETTSGKKDVRMGLGKDFMQNIIKDNFIWGTGFDNRWRTKEGGDAGYETSDYPLLSAIAMKGIIGILIFLPVYIVLIKSLILDVKFIKKRVIDFNNKEFYLLVVFIIYFGYELAKYMSWFSPVSLTKRSSWFIFLAMYLGSRNVYYSSLRLKCLKNKPIQ